MITQQTTLTRHPATAQLLAQVRAQEDTVAQLEEEKAGCQYQIEQYYRLLRGRVGDLLTELLAVQLQLARQRAGQTGRRSDAEAARGWQEQLDSTNRVIQDAIAHQPVDLAETAQPELKRLYRQAVTLAHPDRHANNPDRMAQATAFMMQLNDAYQRQDLPTVRRLVQDLTDGRLFLVQDDTTYSIDTLRQWLQRLTDRQQALQAEIAQLTAESAYQYMTNGTDLTAHFTQLHTALTQQLAQLQR